jgi:hypothetical protein
LGCDACKNHVCGLCIDEGKVVDGPSGEDHCLVCLPLYALEKGKRKCAECKEIILDQDIDGCCCYCNLYFCYICTGETFTENEYGEDICRECKEKEDEIMETSNKLSLM